MEIANVKSQQVKAKKDYLEAGVFRLPFKVMQIEDGTELLVPRGLSRNTLKNAWQLKVIKHGEIVISGSISDTMPTAQENLDLVIEELKRQAAAYVTPRHKTGKSLTVKPMPELTDIKLRWQVVVKTPTLIASVYSPENRQDVKINVGSDRALQKDSSLLRRKLAVILVIEDRIKSKASIDLAAEMTRIELVNVEQRVQALVSSLRLQALVQTGAELRVDS
jgi:hypothetical protein